MEASSDRITTHFDLWYTEWRKEFDAVLHEEGLSDLALFEQALNDRSGDWRPNPFDE